MTRIEKEFGFDLENDSWKHDENKAHTHGYSKTMNQPRFKSVCPCNDLGFSCSDQHAVQEALDEMCGLDGMMSDIADEDRT